MPRIAETQVVRGPRTKYSGTWRILIGDRVSAGCRIADDPFRYQDLQSGVRRILLRRFPYAVYFAVEPEAVVVLAVLHVSRDPAEWQRRRRV